jgi:alpha-galactosidase
MKIKLGIVSSFFMVAALLFTSASFCAAETNDFSASIVTPPAPATPRINGPNIFGVRPGSPFLYAIPSTGDRPMEFSVDHLPNGLVVDATSGQITGSIKKKGEYQVVLRAKNSLGSVEKKFRIVVGETISLTPPMGWNDWNCWGGSVDQEKILRSARAMVASGLNQHGWTYINIDDTWQGKRTGKDHALQGNEKFPDLKSLCAELHSLGLKAGIYSTPWITSYAKFPGGASAQSDGAWSKTLANAKNQALGKYSFAQADAKQWADYGFDYLKYDWYPNDVPHTAEMSKALRASGRDILFSLSNTAPFEHANDWQQWANCWRTNGDIRDTWASAPKSWANSVSEIAFSQDHWAPFAGPGHWNDMDMLVVGKVGWGPKLHPTALTPEEQYTHFSMWCMLSAPLLIGCDLEQLDAFTKSLLSNDEVIALDQDALGRQATRVATVGAVDVYLKPLEDGSSALGFFNRDSTEVKINFDKLKYIGFKNDLHVRNLWRQLQLPDLGNVETEKLSMTIPAHGVQLYKLTPVATK